MDKKNNSTTELYRILSNSDNIGMFLDKYSDEFEKASFTVYINELIKEKKCTIPQIIDKSNMSQSYCYQIIKGIRKPSRDKIIQISFGLGLSLDETNKLLQVGEKSELYCRNKRDAIIIYCINNGYSIIELEDLLNERGMQSIMEVD